MIMVYACVLYGVCMVYVCMLYGVSMTHDVRISDNMRMCVCVV